MSASIEPWREIIPWPRGDAALNPATEFDNYTKAINAIATGAADLTNDPKLLDTAWKLYDQDGARRTSVDGRAASLMAAITLAATLVTGVAFTAFRDPTALPDTAFWAMAATMVSALLYLTSTGIGVFIVHGELRRSLADPVDLAERHPGTSPRALAVQVLTYTVANYRTSNLIAERLFATQRCFRNGLVVLALGGLVTATLTVFDKTPASALPLAQALALRAGCGDRPTLTPSADGGWSGKCARNGAVATVRLSKQGEVSFPP